MTNRSISPAVVVEEVEAYIDSLPTARRRKRGESDQSPESENYSPVTEVTPSSITIELDADALTELPWLLHRLGRARNDAVAQLITAKIYDLLGVKLEGGE